MQELQGWEHCPGAPQPAQVSRARCATIIWFLCLWWEEEEEEEEKH